jgi:hypothetical protein
MAAEPARLAGLDWVKGIAPGRRRLRLFDADATWT